MKRTLYAGIFLLCVAMPSFAYSIDGFSVTGGPKYLGWSPQDSALPYIVVVRAPKVRPERIKPVIVIMLVDVSRTMDEGALRFAKCAAKDVVANLNAGDYFGLVSYNTTAQTIYPLQPQHQDRSVAGLAIDRLDFGDERDLMQGILQAVGEFDRFKNLDALGRYLFIVTNGDPSRGVTDPLQIIQRTVAIGHRNGITVSTFAYKREHRDFNDDLLMNIAYRTSGRYSLQFEHYANTADFIDETNRVCASASRDVVIELRPPKGVGITNVRGGFPENNRIALGDMESGSFRMVSFDLVNRPQRSSDFTVILTSRPGDADYYSHSRTFLDVPISPTLQGFNPKNAPAMLLLDFQIFLADYAATLVGNRALFTGLYRNKLWELERLKSQVFSNFFNYMLDVIKANEEVIANPTIDDDLLAKRVKYHSNRIYYGWTR
jgi:hypothetical protein